MTYFRPNLLLGWKARYIRRLAGHSNAIQQQQPQQQQLQYHQQQPQQQAYQQQAAPTDQAKLVDDEDEDFDIQLDIPQSAASFRPEADDVSAT